MILENRSIAVALNLPYPPVYLVSHSYLRPLTTLARTLGGHVQIDHVDQKFGQHAHDVTKKKPPTRFYAHRFGQHQQRGNPRTCLTCKANQKKTPLGRFSASTNPFPMSHLSLFLVPPPSILGYTLLSLSPSLSSNKVLSCPASKGSVLPLARSPLFWGPLSGLWYTRILIT